MMISLTTSLTREITNFLKNVQQGLNLIPAVGRQTEAWQHQSSFILTMGPENN
jgi:hypothetical protein